MQNTEYIDNLLKLEASAESCCRAVYHLIDQINLVKEGRDVIDYIDNNEHTQYFLLIENPRKILSIVCNCVSNEQKIHKAYLMHDTEPSFILKY